MAVAAVIVSGWLEELLSGIGSVWSAFTEAVLVITPGAPATVKIVTVAVPPFTMVPRRQVTVPSPSEHVPVGGGEREFGVAGNASVTVTWVAKAGPLLVPATCR